MLKRGVLALSAFAIVGAAHAEGPTDTQVKQALYDRYATTQGAEDLKKALNTEVAVSDCNPIGEQYRCLIQNKALNTSIPMVFAFDKAAGKWSFVKEEAK